MRNCRGVQRAQALPRARRGTGCRIRNTVFWLIFLAVHSGVVSQVSWTKEVKKARKGESSVSLYDAEGYSALKRSRERGEADSLAPLLTIVVSYPGSYSKIVFILYVFEYSMDFLCFAHCDFSGSFVFKNGSDT